MCDVSPRVFVCSLHSSISPAFLYQIPVRCVYMTTPREIANHLNFFRQIITEGKVRRIPAVAYHMFKSVVKGKESGWSRC